jgi:hypothetical protein
MKNSETVPSTQQKHSMHGQNGQNKIVTGTKSRTLVGVQVSREKLLFIATSPYVSLFNHVVKGIFSRKVELRK